MTEPDEANPGQVRVTVDKDQATLHVKVGGTIGIREPAAVAEIKDTFLDLIQADTPVQELLDEANGLMLSGSYQQAIDAFGAIGEAFPDHRSGTHNNAGACLFFLARFEEAVQHYVLARDAGYDARNSEDNIFEAVAEAHKAGDHAAPDWYMLAYPNADRDELETRLRKMSRSSTLFC